jgi:hypothetical protein
MAWRSAVDPMALCGAGMLPMGGMVSMYLLMSLFHLPPWLALVSHLDWTARPQQNQTEGD